MNDLYRPTKEVGFIDPVDWVKVEPEQPDYEAAMGVRPPDFLVGESEGMRWERWIKRQVDAAIGNRILIDPGNT